MLPHLSSSTLEEPGLVSRADVAEEGPPLADERHDLASPPRVLDVWCLNGSLLAALIS